MLRILIPFALFAVQAPTIALAPAEGSKTVHVSSIEMSVSGFTATVNSDVNSTYTKVSDTDYTLEQTATNLKIVANGQELPFESKPLKVVSGRDGALKSIEGGVEGANEAMTFLLFRFVPTPAEADKTTTVELKGNGSDIPDQKVESTYIGPKKVEAGEGYEFKQKTTAGEFTSETEYVVKPDGTILEAKSKFSGLAVPAAGASAEGTATLKIKL